MAMDKRIKQQSESISVVMGGRSIASMDVVKASKPSTPPEVPTQQTRLAEALDSLHDRISVLENKLEPVCRIEPTSGNSPDAISVSLCGLADTLRTYVDTVSRATDRINSLIERQQVS